MAMEIPAKAMQCKTYLRRRILCHLAKDSNSIFGQSDIYISLKSGE